MVDQRGDDQEGVLPGQSVEVAVGELVELAVEDLPGAGYRWQLRDRPEGLLVLDDEVEAQEPVGAGVGGPSRRVLHMRPTTAGTYRLELVLVRPWEPSEVPPARRRTVALTVLPSAPPPA